MDQHAAPILEALSKVERKPPVGFGAPGHGGGRAATRDVLRLVGRRAFEADVLTPKGLDDRTERGQVVQQAHALAAEAWGADLCRFAFLRENVEAGAFALDPADPGQAQGRVTND